MNLENLLEKPIWQMTGEQFLVLLENNVKSTDPEPHNVPSNTLEKKYVYGIRGIANLMNCSISTANRIKKKGILNDAIIQQGRSIIVDVEKALELLRENSDL
jgi:hypothetical protein